MFGWLRKREPGRQGPIGAQEVREWFEILDDPEREILWDDVYDIATDRLWYRHVLITEEAVRETLATLERFDPEADVPWIALKLLRHADPTGKILEKGMVLSLQRGGRLVMQFVGFEAAGLPESVSQELAALIRENASFWYWMYPSLWRFLR